MSTSLRDQLVQAGLASQKDAEAVERQKQQRRKNNKKLKKSGKAVQKDTAIKDKLAKENAAKKARDQKLSKEREEQQAKRQRRGQINALLEKHTLNDRSGDIAHHFVHANKVRRVYINKKQQEELGSLQAAICVFRGRYHLVPKAIADQLAKIGPEAVLYYSEPDKKTAKEDDPYADFEVPDDLMW